MTNVKCDEHRSLYCIRSWTEPNKGLSPPVFAPMEWGRCHWTGGLTASLLKCLVSRGLGSCGWDSDLQPDSWLQDGKAGLWKACAGSRRVVLLICHEGKLMGIGRACNASDFNAWTSVAILCCQLNVPGAVLSFPIQRCSMWGSWNFASFTGFWLCNCVVRDAAQRKQACFRQWRCCLYMRKILIRKLQAVVGLLCCYAIINSNA